MPLPVAGVSHVMVPPVFHVGTWPLVGVSDASTDTT